MIVKHYPPSGDRFYDRNVVNLCKRNQFSSSARVENPTSGNDQGFLGFAQDLRRFGNTVTVGPGSRDLVHRFFEKSLRIIEGFRLDVLG